MADTISPESLFTTAVTSLFDRTKLVAHSDWKKLNLVRLAREAEESCYYETDYTPWNRRDFHYCIPSFHEERLLATGKAVRFPISVDALVSTRGYEGDPRRLQLLRVRPPGSNGEGEEVRSKLTLQVKITEISGFEGITCIESTPDSGLPKRSCASSGGVGFSNLIPPAAVSVFDPRGWDRDFFFMSRKLVWRGKLTPVEVIASLNCSTPLPNREACEIVDLKPKKAK